MHFRAYSQRQQGRSHTPAPPAGGAAETAQVLAHMHLCPHTQQEHCLKQPALSKLPWLEIMVLHGTACRCMGMGNPGLPTYSGN